MQEYKLDSLVRSDLEATEEQIVTFSDIALDCVKLPGTRRPEMKDVARRLAALLSELKGDDRKKEAEEEAAKVTASVGGSGKSTMESLLDEIEEETKISEEKSDKFLGKAFARILSIGM